jgi:hypothetical protein
MSGEARKSGKTQLALALAQGVSIAAWAHANAVPAPTAFRWARDPAVRKAVESYRRRTIDQAVGLMAKNSTKAARIIVAAAVHAESESVRLRAARAIFSDMMTVSKYVGLEERMTEIEEQVAQQRDDDAKSTVLCDAQANHGQGATPPVVRSMTSIAGGAA